MNSVKKICVLGMFGVGKTSIVDRIAFDRFSTDYKTTIGVRPISAVLNAGQDNAQRVVLWDIAGESNISRLTRTYLVGSDAFAIIIDGLRKESVEVALRIAASCKEEYPSVPLVFLVNKSDVLEMWDVTQTELERELCAQVFAVSARTGEGVHNAFISLLELL